MDLCAAGVSWLAGSLAGIFLSAAFAAVTACLALVIFFSAAGMALFFAAAERSGAEITPASARPVAVRAASALASRARAALRSGLAIRWSSTSAPAVQRHRQ